MWRAGWVAVVSAFSIFAMPLVAQAKRVALVVGINRYDNLTRERQLVKAVNDARAMEGALKMARAHGRKIDSQKIELIALENSFHGRTFGALSITGQEKYRRVSHSQPHDLFQSIG